MRRISGIHPSRRRSLGGLSGARLSLLEMPNRPSGKARSQIQKRGVGMDERMGRIETRADTDGDGLHAAECNAVELWRISSHYAANRIAEELYTRFRRLASVLKTTEEVALRKKPRIGSGRKFGRLYSSEWRTVQIGRHRSTMGDVGDAIYTWPLVCPTLHSAAYVVE